jgi:hypothetical protein
VKAILGLVLFLAVSTIVSCSNRFWVESPTTGLSLSEFKIHERVGFLGVCRIDNHYTTISIRNTAELKRRTRRRSSIILPKFCIESRTWYFVDLKPNYTSEFFEDRYLVSITFATSQTGPRPEITGIDRDGNIKFIQTYHRYLAYGDTVRLWDYLIELPKTFRPKSFSVQLSAVKAPCSEGKDCVCDEWR